MQQTFRMYSKSKRKCRFFLLVITVMMPAVAFDSNTACERKKSASTRKSDRHQKKAIAKAEQQWLKIIAVLRTEKVGNAKDDLTDHWMDVFDKADRHFEAMLKGGHEREKVAYFVRQFGKHGPQADFRWLLARVDATLNPGSGGGLYSGTSNLARQRRRTQLLMAEMQVKHFLLHKKKFERYYNAVVWVGLHFNTDYRLASLIMFTEQGLAMKDKTDYWWYARNAMLLFHATGRDDLLTDRKPEDLARAFREWHHWFKTEGMFLRPVEGSFTLALDKRAKRENRPYLPFLKLPGRLPPLISLPTHPFPKWVGTRPPHKRFIPSLQ